MERYPDMTKFEYIADYEEESSSFTERFKYMYRDPDWQYDTFSQLMSSFVYHNQVAIFWWLAWQTPYKLFKSAKKNGRSYFIKPFISIVIMLCIFSFIIIFDLCLWAINSSLYSYKCLTFVIKISSFSSWSWIIQL